MITTEVKPIVFHCCFACWSTRASLADPLVLRSKLCCSAHSSTMALLAALPHSLYIGHSRSCLGHYLATSQKYVRITNAFVPQTIFTTILCLLTTVITLWFMPTSIAIVLHILPYFVSHLYYDHDTGMYILLPMICWYDWLYAGAAWVVAKSSVADLHTVCGGVGVCRCGGVRRGVGGGM